jgi:2'-5' RNA ligase
MARIRTFIAIETGKAVRDRIIALQETLARTGAQVNWVERDNIHLTLLFLGEVDDRTLPELCRAVSENTCKHSPFAMSIETVGCFPNPRRPRVVWVGVGAGVQEVCSLHDDLEESLLELGCYRREERKYTPHLTLGRIKSDRPAESLAMAIASHSTWKAGTTTVTEVLVMSSQLTPDGPVYTIMSRAKLGE